MNNECNSFDKIEIKNTKIDNEMSFGDIYLINVLDKFSVSAKRETIDEGFKKRSFSNLLDERTFIYLKEYLFSYPEKPLLLPTSRGYALVYGSMFPSTRMFFVSFIKAKNEETLLKAVSFDFLDDILLFEPLEKSSGNRSKNTKSVCDGLEFVINNINNLFSKPENKMLIYGENCVEKLKSYIESASMITGCELNALVYSDAVFTPEFDRYMFGAFLLSMLLLCKRLGKTKCAEVSLTACKEGLASEISFELSSVVSVASIPELSPFTYLARKNNMLFEYLLEDNLLRVKFCPVRKDWSFIEVKSYLEFDWDS